MNILKTLPDSPWFAWTSMAVGVIGILLAIVFYIKSQKRISLSGSSVTQIFIHDEQTRLDNLKVIYNGKEIRSLYVTKYTIVNTGNEVIKYEAIDSKNPLEIHSEKKAGVLFAKVIWQTSDHIALNVETDIDNQIIRIRFGRFEKKDKVIIYIYHENSYAAFSLCGEIEGGSISKSNYNIDRVRHTFYRQFAASVCVMLCSIFMVVFGKGSEDRLTGVVLILFIVLFTMGHLVNYIRSCESMGVSKEDALKIIIKPISGAKNEKNI